MYVIFLNYILCRIENKGRGKGIRRVTLASLHFVVCYAEVSGELLASGLEKSPSAPCKLCMRIETTIDAIAANYDNNNCANNTPGDAKERGN